MNKRSVKKVPSRQSRAGRWQAARRQFVKASARKTPRASADQEARDVCRSHVFVTAGIASTDHRRDRDCRARLWRARRRCGRINFMSARRFSIRRARSAGLERAAATKWSSCFRPMVKTISIASRIRAKRLNALPRKASSKSRAEVPPQEFRPKLVTMRAKSWALVYACRATARPDRYAIVYGALGRCSRSAVEWGRWALIPRSEARRCAYGWRPARRHCW